MEFIRYANNRTFKMWNDFFESQKKKKEKKGKGKT